MGRRVAPWDGPPEGAATNGGARKAQQSGKMVAGREESDEHERRLDGIILAGPRDIPADG